MELPSVPEKLTKHISFEQPVHPGLEITALMSNFVVNSL